jgi:hypothetical protein
MVSGMLIEKARVTYDLLAGLVLISTIPLPLLRCGGAEETQVRGDDGQVKLTLRKEPFFIQPPQN